MRETMQADPASLNRKVHFAARRVLIRKRLRLLFRALLAGSFFCLVLVTLSRFVYVPHSYKAVLTALAISAAVGLVLVLRRKVSPFEGACELDSVFTLKERLATAIELQERGEVTEPLAASQLADSVKISESVNPSVVRVGIPKEAPLIIFFLILCASIALFEPLYSVAGRTAKELQIRESIRLQLAREGLRERGDLKKAFDETAQEIEKGEMKQALISVAALREDLSREYSKAAEKERAVAELEAHPQLAKVAQALRQGSPEALAAESERLTSEGAGAAKTAQILKDIAREISQDAVFKRLVERFVKAIEMRNQEELEEALKGLATSLRQTVSTKAILEAVASLEVTEEKIAEATGGAIIERTSRRIGTTPPRSTHLPPPEQITAPIPSEEIEQAIAKQNVPERFKQVVRGYFSR